MINAITQSVALDFLVDGEGAAVFVVVKFHLGGVETSFALHEITNRGVFNDHFGPERVARKAEKVGFFFGSDFYYDIGPAGEDVFGLENFLLRKSFGDNFVELVVRSKKNLHALIIA